MRLILEENSFKFTERHYVQTPGIAMGSKIDVAFSVIFMVDQEERLLSASPFKPPVWKRFTDDVFTLWYIPSRKVRDLTPSPHPLHTVTSYPYFTIQEKTSHQWNNEQQRNVILFIQLRFSSLHSYARLDRLLHGFVPN